jgi:hypothetical protein
MVFTVEVKIGGIVIFVQLPGTTGQERMHVLALANARHAHTMRFHPDMVNSPDRFVDIRGESLPLFNDLKGGKDKVPLPNLIRASTVTGRPVPAQLFKDPWQDGGVRLVLPRPLGYPKPGDTVLASAKKGNKTVQLGYVTGELTFAYQAEREFEIKGELIRPNDRGVAKIWFDYRSDHRIDNEGGGHGHGHGEGKRPGTKGDPMDHPRAHFDVVGDGAWELFTEEDYPNKGGNPVECASGGGCPPDDINC